MDYHGHAAGSIFRFGVNYLVVPVHQNEGG
jgi:hypothetical protein